MADNTSSRSDDSLSVEDKSCIEQSKTLLSQSSEKAEENLGTKTSTKKVSFKKRRSRTIQAFVASAGIVMCAQLALTTYSKSILTSIEKYFGISSSLAGFIVGSFNIGNLLLVVAVSKFSSTGHRPRIIAIGTLLIALGGFINFTPHLAHDSYQPRRNDSMLDEEYHVPAANPNLYVILIIGEILQGVGATVHIPLSSSYIDDFAPENSSPVYLGILFVLQNIGPAVGYLVGSWSSSLYVDFNVIEPDQIPVQERDTDAWIGAWWLGYLIISAWVFVAALPLFFFPKSLKTNKEKRNLATSEASSNLLNTSQTNLNPEKKFVRKARSFFKDFWQTFKRLITNLPFMLIVFGYTSLMFVVSCLTSFMPKFLEVVFSKSSGSANLIFGLAIPPTVCIGLLSGGIIVKKFNWNRIGILKFVIISGVSAVIPIFIVMFISCESANEECEAVSFNHSNITQSLTSTNIQTCQESICRLPSIIFVLLTSVAALMASNMVTPIFTVLLRSVDQNDKCTAIGVLFFVLRAFGMIPAPIICGAVIDHTCTEWNEEQGVETNCLQYNEENFRIRYLLINLVGLIMSILFVSGAYFMISFSSRQEEEKPNPGFFRRFIKQHCNCPREQTINQNAV